MITFLFLTICVKYFQVFSLIIVTVIINLLTVVLLRQIP